MPTISPPAISPSDVVQEPCGAGGLTIAISVVTAALVVLAAIMCAIYVR